MEWSAPQYVMAGMIRISVLGNTILHKRTTKINAWSKLVDGMLVAIVLYWGGFWS